MIFEKVCVLGVGALGGFVVDSISKIDSIKEIIIFDGDLVEDKNLKNSIYRLSDVGKPKVECLKQIVTMRIPNIKITLYKLRFIEGETFLPTCNLVLDCRDYLYDRGTLIDTRLYISSRYLVVDCRKNIQSQLKYEGQYLELISSNDLKTASSLVTMLMTNKTLEKMITAQTVNKFDLDFMKINDTQEDIIYDSTAGEQKFINLPQSIPLVLEQNKSSPIDVYVGGKSFPLFQNVIPQNSLHSSGDLIMHFVSMVQSPFKFNSYVISISQGPKFYIELLPETGAA
jgi:hypothetical protein